MTSPHTNALITMGHYRLNTITQNGQQYYQIERGAFSSPAFQTLDAAICIMIGENFREKDGTLPDRLRHLARQLEVAAFIYEEENQWQTFSPD